MTSDETGIERDEARAPSPLEAVRTGMQAFVADTPDPDINETGLADEFARLLRGDTQLAVHCQGRFCCFNPDRGVFETLDETALRNLLFDLQSVPRPTRSFYRVSQALVNKVVRILADRLHDPRFFDDSPPGIAVPNGYLAFYDRRLELQDHSPINRARLFIPIPFDERADTSSLDAFMATSLPDPSLTDLVFEFAGVALFGEGGKHQTAAILVGSGANGKGVFTQLIEKLVPPSMRSAVSPSEWKNDFQRMKLAGSILNTVGELPPLDNASWQVMKGIIAGDLTTWRPVGGNQFELKPTALHIFSTNQLPRVHQVGEAIRRRFRIIPFLNSVPIEQRNPNMAADLFENHAAAFLLRCVQGVTRVVQRRYIANPEACEKAMDRWLAQSDPITTFVNDQVEQTGDPNDRVTVKAMYDAAVSHANDGGFNPPSSPKYLTTALNERGLHQTKSSSMYWTCVRLRVAR